MRLEPFGSFWNRLDAFGSVCERLESSGSFWMRREAFSSVQLNAYETYTLNALPVQMLGQDS